MQRWFIIGGALLLIIGATTVYYRHAMPNAADRPNVRTQKVVIAGETLTAEVADTEALREQGLSGRDGLASGTAMLFIFQTDGTWVFWMKDMKFPIDIVWADSSLKVVTVASDVAPDTYPQAFNPSAPARYALELPAGWVAAHGVSEGARVLMHANAPR